MLRLQDLNKKVKVTVEGKVESFEVVNKEVCANIEIRHNGFYYGTVRVPIYVNIEILEESCQVSF